MAECYWYGASWERPYDFKPDLKAARRSALNRPVSKYLPPQSNVKRRLLAAGISDGRWTREAMAARDAKRDTYRDSLTRPDEPPREYHQRGVRDRVHATRGLNPDQTERASLYRGKHNQQETDRKKTKGARPFSPGSTAESHRPASPQRDDRRPGTAESQQRPRTAPTSVQQVSHSLKDASDVTHMAPTRWDPAGGHPPGMWNLRSTTRANPDEQRQEDYARTRERLMSAHGYIDQASGTFVHTERRDTAIGPDLPGAMQSVSTDDGKGLPVPYGGVNDTPGQFEWSTADTQNPPSLSASRQASPSTMAAAAVLGRDGATSAVDGAAGGHSTEDERHARSTSSKDQRGPLRGATVSDTRRPASRSSQPPSDAEHIAQKRAYSSEREQAAALSSTSYRSDDPAASKERRPSPTKDASRKATPPPETETKRESLVRRHYGHLADSESTSSGSDDDHDAGGRRAKKHRKIRHVADDDEGRKTTPRDEARKQMRKLKLKSRTDGGDDGGSDDQDDDLIPSQPSGGGGRESARLEEFRRMTPREHRRQREQRRQDAAGYEPDLSRVPARPDFRAKLRSAESTPRGSGRTGDRTATPAASNMSVHQVPTGATWGAPVAGASFSPQHGWYGGQVVASVPLQYGLPMQVPAAPVAVVPPGATVQMPFAPPTPITTDDQQVAGSRLTPSCGRGGAEHGSSRDDQPQLSRTAASSFGGTVTSTTGVSAPYTPPSFATAPGTPMYVQPQQQAQAMHMTAGGGHVVIGGVHPTFAPQPDGTWVVSPGGHAYPAAGATPPSGSNTRFPDRSPERGARLSSERGRKTRFADDDSMASFAVRQPAAPKAAAPRGNEEDEGKYARAAKQYAEAVAVLSTRDERSPAKQPSSANPRRHDHRRHPRDADDVDTEEGPYYHSTTADDSKKPIRPVHDDYREARRGREDAPRDHDVRGGRGAFKGFTGGDGSDTEGASSSAAGPAASSKEVFVDHRRKHPLHAGSGARQQHDHHRAQQKDRYGRDRRDSDSDAGGYGRARRDLGFDLAAREEDSTDVDEFEVHRAP